MWTYSWTSTCSDDKQAVSWYRMLSAASARQMRIQLGTACRDFVKFLFNRFSQFRDGYTLSPYLHNERRPEVIRQLRIDGQERTAPMPGSSLKL